MSGPLAGRRLVVTRGKGPSTHLAALLEERGASVVEVPSIEIVPPCAAMIRLRRASGSSGSAARNAATRSSDTTAGGRSGSGK